MVDIPSISVSPKIVVQEFDLRNKNCTPLKIERIFFVRRGLNSLQRLLESGEMILHISWFVLDILFHV